MGLRRSVARLLLAAVSDRDPVRRVDEEAERALEPAVAALIVHDADDPVTELADAVARALKRARPE